MTLKKEAFKGAKKLWVLKELSAAKAGQSGYYIIPRSIDMMGDMQIMFTDRADEAGLCRAPIMSFYVLKKEDYCALIRIERNYKYQFDIMVKDGVYTVAPLFDFEDVKKDPVYDDIRLEIIELPLASELGDFAKAERDIRLARGEIVTLREKCASPAVEYARKYPLIRIRMGWKPSPSPVFHQTVENEPDMSVSYTHLKGGGGRTRRVLLLGRGGLFPSALPRG